MCRKIQCDRKSEKFYKISQKLNKAQIRLTQAQQASCFLSWLMQGNHTQALFSSEFFSNFGTVAFSFLFDKYYPIMD